MSRSRVICVLRDEPFLSLPTSLNSPRSFLQNGAENGPREERNSRGKQYLTIGGILAKKRMMDSSRGERNPGEAGFQWKSCGLLIRTKERRERLRESVRGRARERGRGIWPQSLQ